MVTTLTTICHVCLSANRTLRELDKNLSEYLSEICDIPVQSRRLCFKCEDSLKNNLDFRNNCRKANLILIEWEQDKSLQKLPIQSLQKLLQNASPIDEYFKQVKNYFNHSKLTTDDNNVDLIKDVLIREDFIKEVFIKEDLIKDDLIKDIIIKEDIIKDVLIKDDVIKEDLIKDDVINEVLIKVEDVNENSKLYEDIKEIEYDKTENETKINDESDSIFIVTKKVKIKSKKKSKSISDITKPERKFKLRGEIAKRSEFTQYEAVFDVELFATYADAKKELLRRRVSEPYVSAQFKCRLCHTVYKNEGLLQFHMKWHDPSPELSHVCDVCGMRFATRSTMLKHKPNCHRGKFSCKMCPLVTYQRQVMKAHFQKHQGKIYKCHCDRTFKHISSYMTHKRRVHVSAHVCVACARTFVSDLGLKDHVHKMHPTECKTDSDTAVRCEPCGLKFANQQVYNVHVLNTNEHKDIASSLIACSVCGFAFEETSQLKEHKRIYHSRAQKPNRSLERSEREDRESAKERQLDNIECKLCGNAGTSQSWLYQHYRRSHPSERYEAPRGRREYLCDQCGKGFYKKLQLIEHTYVHLGLKPFRCETCFKAFRTKMSLKNHSERHSPPSRECPQCGKKFNSASNLSNHIRSHTGDRRFVCAYCGKGFLHSAALRQHVRGVHLHIRRERRATHKQTNVLN